MSRSPVARGAFMRAVFVRPGLDLLAGLALLAASAAATPAHAAEAPVPGGAIHAPEPSAAPERARPTRPATVEAEGLYSYMTPFASPRWLRLQQDGDVLWGTIDINGPFGFCARTSVDGWVSGDVITFDVDLTTTPCPCSGSNAALRFTGTIDEQGGIVGTWANNCTPPTGSWWACRSMDPPQGGVCDPLPDYPAEPPYPVAQVPAAGSLALAALAFALAGSALLRRRRGAESRAA